MTLSRAWRRLVSVVAVGFAYGLRPALAQAPRPTSGEAGGATARTMIVTPGARYRAGWLRRAMFGADYRALWTTPIAVEVLDLRTVGGGLRPTERGGGLQTQSLRLKGAGGREYTFRLIEKDPGRALPPELRETLVRDVLQDQVSAFHPAAAVVVAPLLDATGIRHAPPTLAVLPDDPSLGEFRADFAGRLGTLEERPGPGFDESELAAGADRVVSSERLFELLMQSHNVRVDTRAFLAARLFDIFVGDRDRHRDQWRWARFGPADTVPWEPIPRDRDMAFTKNEGLLLWLASAWYPQLVSFGPTYPEMLGLTWNGREIDRRLLTWLERPVWDSVARALQAALTDSVIDAATLAMPEQFEAKNGGELRAALRSRRDRLPRAAAEFYELLAREVDLHGTNRADLVEVTRLDDGSVDVALSPLARGRASSGGRRLRRFHPRETADVRIYLHGGDDRAIVRGGERGMTIRVIGGGDDDELIDSSSAGGRTRFYDDSGENRIALGRGTVIDRRPYTPPPTARPQDPPRDWGHDWRLAPWASYSPDIGLFIGPGRTLYRYGFRFHPYRSRTTLQVGYAIGANKPRAQLRAELRRSNSDHFATVEARASGIEVISFYGIGNETPSNERRSFYRVYQTQYSIAPAYVAPLTRATTLSLGVAGQYTTTDERRSTLVGEARPYGSGRFGQLGARVGFGFDTRDRPVAATRGLHLDAGGTVYPAVLDVDETFGELHGSAAAYLSASAPLEPTLALRVGGKRLWGEFPFYEAAFVGGSSTVRGWSEQRFAGRASVYANAELRLFLTKVSLFIPADLGLVGIADAGRVYAAGERSSELHTGFGGGLWFAPLKRTNTVSLSVVRGKERTGIYLRSGFLF